MPSVDVHTEDITETPLQKNIYETCIVVRAFIDSMHASQHTCGLEAEASWSVCKTRACPLKPCAIERGNNRYANGFIKRERRASAWHFQSLGGRIWRFRSHDKCSTPRTSCHIQMKGMDLNILWRRNQVLNSQLLQCDDAMTLPTNWHVGFNPLASSMHVLDAICTFSTHSRHTYVCTLL